MTTTRNVAATGTYEAFISYRRDFDRRWASWLHRQLESWRTPRGVVGARSKLDRVFLDDDELSAGERLTDDIQAALRASRSLIVVCSTDTPASRWVNAEVE